MSNALVLLKEGNRPGFIMMAANNDRRVCLFVLKHKDF
jgi:hypothetical protein